MRNFLVLGLGNLLMSDDAAGLHAVYALQKTYPDAVNFRILDGGTLGLDLLGPIAWADQLLILDAVDVAAAPGAVVRVEGDDIDSVFASKLSPHQMGLRDILAAAELCGDRPADLVLLGIQAESISMSMDLSPAVRTGLERLVGVAAEMIDGFLSTCHAPS